MRNFTNLLTLLAIGTALPASAREEGSTAISIGVGDAVRSSAVGTTAVFFNPAGLHQFMQYTVATGYEFVHSLDGHVFSVAAADSSSNQALAMGVAYSYLTGHELGTDITRKGHLLRGAVASGYAGDGWAFHVGAGVRWLDLFIGDDGESSEVTMDVGGLLVLKDLFRLAVVGQNLIETKLQEAPRGIGIGASVLFENLLASFDTVLDFDTLDHTEAQYHVGLEYALGGRLPVRVGYQLDQVTERQSVSAGIGYVSQLMALDFGFQQDVEDKNDNTFSFNVRIFVP